MVSRVLPLVLATTLCASGAAAQMEATDRFCASLKQAKSETPVATATRIVGDADKANILLNLATCRQVADIISGDAAHDFAPIHGLFFNPSDRIALFVQPYMVDHFTDGFMTDGWGDTILLRQALADHVTTLMPALKENRASDEVVGQVAETCFGLGVASADALKEGRSSTSAFDAHEVFLESLALIKGGFGPNAEARARDTAALRAALETYDTDRPWKSPADILDYETDFGRFCRAHEQGTLSAPRNPSDISDLFDCDRFGDVLVATDFYLPSYDLYRNQMKEGSEFRRNALAWERDYGFGKDEMPLPPIEGATCKIEERTRKDGDDYGVLSCSFSRPIRETTQAAREAGLRAVMNSVPACFRDRIENSGDFSSIYPKGLAAVTGDGLAVGDRMEIEYTPARDGKVARASGHLFWVSTKVQRGRSVVGIADFGDEFPIAIYRVVFNFFD